MVRAVPIKRKHTDGCDSQYQRHDHKHIPSVFHRLPPPAQNSPSHDPRLGRRFDSALEGHFTDRRHILSIALIAPPPVNGQCPFHFCRIILQAPLLEHKGKSFCGYLHRDCQWFPLPQKAQGRRNRRPHSVHFLSAEALQRYRNQRNASAAKAARSEAH